MGVTVAVTGLNATDNPGPGVAVIRALRAHPDFDGTVVGLAYDTLEPGIYASDLVYHVFLIPYPSQGLEAYEARLRYIHERVGMDAIIPTLDAELPRLPTGKLYKRLLRDRYWGNKTSRIV